MELITDNWLSWSFVVIAIIALLYMAHAIKHEKDLYLETAKEVVIGPFRLLIPGWWSDSKTPTDKELHYERSDTRYAWAAQFKLQADHGEDLTQLFENHIKGQKIIFDPEDSVIHNTSQQMCRVEGTATQDEIERVYYDAFLKRDEKTKMLLLGESKSSILNGSLEGPYFDEVVKRLSTLN